ncbi:MAG: CHAT domain-containing protein [Coleofasciculus chthonoplastes F3-SA18-01]|uniref:CHAT domain-containing protein n=1 Tax=Coleofasciculus chthonoplastes TaxID=64178 RepID=UPI0033005E34
MSRRYSKVKTTVKGSWNWLKHPRSFIYLILGAFFLTLSLQSPKLPATAAYPPLEMGNQMGEIVENRGETLAPAMAPLYSQTAEPSDLVEQGKLYYQAGQFDQAAQVWQEAAETYAAEGFILKQAQALNYLALAYKELGNTESAQSAIAQSLNQLQSKQDTDNNTRLLLAQALNTKGTIHLLQGQSQTALDTWKKSASIYKQADDQTGQLISQINQAQALQALGKYRRAKSLLEQLVSELQNEPNSLMKAKGLRSLGVALQTLGQLRQSKAALEASWQISQQLNSPQDTSEALFSIGNVARDLQEYAVAWTYYQQAAELTPDPLTQLEAQLNQLRMVVELQRWDVAQEFIPIVTTKVNQLSASRPAIYAQINLADSLMKYDQAGMTNSLAVDTSKLLAKAVKQARQINDPRAEAYALYQLGKLYQANGALDDSKTLSQQALKLAQEINADDIAARAGGQLGEILQKQGKTSEALAAYKIAFDNIQSLRSDLVAISSDVQFDFKEGIEPLYRQLVSLLLKEEDNQGNLQQARDVMEALQLAELDNFFQDACLDTNPVALEEIDTQAAVIYPIILPDRLEVILSIPNQPLTHYATQLTQAEVESTLTQLYSALSPGYPSSERLQLSQQVYNWLIQPAEAAMASRDIKTLVFVPDGFLRNLPMAALYDGEQYILQKYQIVFSPGLQLFPQGLSQDELSLLAAGLTEARQGFSPLPGVDAEIAQVSKQVKSKVLFNENFTFGKFKDLINNESFPIVHLATHGQFSSNPEETFLLTWSDRISIEDFDLIFQKRRLGLLKPIELLVMSACQTAAGDNRATLGLAGFALRSGAKSTIASLWSVSDESTSIMMREFYHQLTDLKVSKAEALRQAQLSLLEEPLYKHPYFWASFVLIGNWL